MAKKRNRGQVADQGGVHEASTNTQDEASTPVPPQLQAVLACLQAGRLVLCVGSGFAQVAGRPTWRELAEKLADTLTDKLADADTAAEVRELLDTRPLTAASFIKRSLGEGFGAALSGLIPKNGVLPPALAVLPQLPFRAVLTTAMDDVVERVYREADTGAPVFTYRDAEALRREGRGRYLLRLFGDPMKGGEAIFGAADLQRLLADGAVRGLVQDLYQRRSFLFVGFAPEDPDFEALVERLVAAACPANFTGPAGSGPRPQHYAILPGLSRVARAELQAAYGIEVLEDLAEPDALSALRALREAFGEHGGDALPDDDDLEGWLGLLQQDPGRAEVLQHMNALERRYNDEGDSDHLLELLLGRIDVESAPPQRAALLLQVAQVLEVQKGQMAEAFTSAMAAYKEDPQPATLDTLERLTGITGQWVELLTELREVITQLPAAARVEVWLRIARIYGDKLNHLDYALASLTEVKKLDPSEDLRRQMLELQVDLCRRAERWKDLADAQGTLAALLTDANRRLDLYLEQGEVFEGHLSDGVSAAAAFRRALDVDPQNRDALAALERLLRRNKRWDELVTTLTLKTGLLRKSGDEAGALAAQREAAALTTEHLGDPKAALERWEAVRREAPGDLETLRALEKLYGLEASLSDRYLQVLADLADNVPSDKERLAIYRRLASEYEDSPGKSQSAAACLEKVLDLDPKAEDAYRGLARLYRQAKNWTLLSDCLRRHAEHAQGAAAQAALYATLGQVYEQDIPEGDRSRALLAAPQAIEAWAQALRLDPESQAAMESLARLYLLTEAYGDAVRLLDKRGNLAEDKATRAALRHEAAEITLTQLSDPRGAEERFVRALEADPNHLPSQRRLAGLYREQGDILRAAKLLQEAAGRSPNRLEKTRCLSEAADAYASVGETAKAIDLYQQALSEDPELAEAGEALVDLLLQEKRPGEAVPVLEMLARKTSDRDEQLGWLNKLGVALRESGDKARALRTFARATELAETDLTAQRNRAELLTAEAHHQGARDAWLAVLKHGRDQLSAGEVVEVLYAIGACERSLGHNAEARDFLQRALELDPAHRPSLRALIELGDSAGLTKEAQIDLRRALLPAAEGDERVKLLTEIGKLQATALQDAEGALQTFAEALQLRPDSHTLLHECLALHSERKDWSAVLTTLERLIALEPNVKRRARYKQTAAVAAREELKDVPRALAFYNSALDDDPLLEKSATDLEKLARDSGEYRELARLYRRKIKQLGPDTEQSTKEQRAERMRLWSSLGLLCLEHLSDMETALAAFEVVAALDRGNLEWRRQLANLYVQAGPDRIDKAISEHQGLLRANKAELQSYRALKDLYLRTNQRDKAAAVAQALLILRKSEPGDDRLIAEVKGRPVKPARRGLPQELWRTLAHPDENQQVGALFQAVFPVVQLGYARSFKEAGVNRKETLDQGLLCAKALRYAVEVMDAVPIDAYGQVNQKEATAVLHLREPGQPAVICVQLGAPMLNIQRPEAEILYEVGRLATSLRARRVLRTLLPTAAQLGMIIDAAIAMNGDPLAAQGRVAETLAGLRKSLSPAVQEQVAQMGKGLREAGIKGEPVAASWLAYADITAARAGLVLCGDLEVVATMMATEPPAGVSPLSPKQRLLELLHFGVTEEYFTIRQHLGLMG